MKPSRTDRHHEVRLWPATASFFQLIARGAERMESSYGRTSVVFDILTELEEAQEFERKSASAGLVIG
jgi:hypothetical protein